MWSTTLVVGVDEERGLLSPTVHLCGRRGFADGVLHLELIDDEGVLHRLIREPLRPELIGTDMRLPTFPVPDGASPEEAVHWRWEIAVEADGIERIRWHKRLLGAVGLGPEGEIALPGPPEGPRSKLEEEGWGPEAPWNPRDSERLLARLLEEKLIDEGERDEVLAWRSLMGGTVERLLIGLDTISEREVLTRYAEVSGCEFVELAYRTIDPEVAALIPGDLARHHGLIAIGHRREMLTVAMSDPQLAPSELGFLYALAGGPIYIVVATRPDVLAALDRVHAP